MTQGSNTGAMAKTRSDITLWRPGNLPTYEPCVCRVKLQTTRPDNLSLPMTHSLMLPCVCMRRSLFLCLSKMYPKKKKKKAVTFKNQRQENRGRDKSKQAISQLSDSFPSLPAVQGLSRVRCGVQHQFLAEGEPLTDNCAHLNSGCLESRKHPCVKISQRQSYTKKQDLLRSPKPLLQNSTLKWMIKS